MKAAWLWMLCCGVVAAQGTDPAPDPSARISAERAQLQALRQSIEQAHNSRDQDCWQHFAVNACLSEVRRSRRAALDPVRARELVLNAEERAWRTQQRDQRLIDKAEGARP